MDKIPDLEAENAIVRDGEFNKTRNLILESWTLPHFPKLKIWFYLSLILRSSFYSFSSLTTLSG
jgi:hypothetical protein